jgi:hypothetical protein
MPAAGGPAPQLTRPGPRRGQVGVIADSELAIAGFTRDAGWASAKIVGLFVLSAAALQPGGLGYERRRAEPLADLRCSRSAPLTRAAVTAACTFVALDSFLFLNTPYLQEVGADSALHAGLYRLPTAAMIVACAALSGRDAWEDPAGVGDEAEGERAIPVPAMKRVA